MREHVNINEELLAPYVYVEAHLLDDSPRASNEEHNHTSVPAVVPRDELFESCHEYLLRSTAGPNAQYLELRYLMA